MKIFSTAQIRAWDAYTIENEPVASVELMNRAAAAFVDWFVECYPDLEQPVWVFAGTGNNGGDGLAVARLLHRRFYTAKVFVCDFSGKRSAGFEAQLVALPAHAALEINWLQAGDVFPEAPLRAVVIDALFGSGLNRVLGEPWLQVIDFLNALPNAVASIDLPSGLFADRHTPGAGVVRATQTFSFETPKRAFFFAENAGRVGDWTYRSIGLHPDFAARTATEYHFFTRGEARARLRLRPKFSHKGSFGHALLIAGSRGKMGAAVLAARAALRAGAGLASAHTPRCGLDVLQTAVPEAMCLVDAHAEHWTQMPDLERFTAIGAGPGIGTAEESATALLGLLQTAAVPLLLDADALNLLAQNPAWWRFVPKNTVLTPHPKEFERLFGQTTDDFERNALQVAKAREHGVFIVLKGAYTATACPDGTCWFNSTGNAGMATGGSGDVLTGIITGLLAQGYAPEIACTLGVYAHGLSGDRAAAVRSQAGLIAGDLIDYLGEAWLDIGGQ